MVSRKEAELQQDTPVAIIMRSKDEYPYVEHALRGLYEQNYQNFVLYNIDSGSSDGTWEVVKRYNPNPDRIVRIKPSDYIPGRVLNLMVAMAREPIIVFLNSDAIPQGHEWLENLVGPILRGEQDATMSRQIPRPDAHFIVKDDYRRAYDPDFFGRKCPDFFSAVSCAFKRSLWEETKFYVDGFSEDVAWAKACREKGARIAMVTDSVVEHSHNYTPSQLFRRKFIEGEADVYIFVRDASFLRQTYACLREILRDLLNAVKNREWLTVPYNLFYRIVCHLGYLKGLRSGQLRHGKKIKKKPLETPEQATAPQAVQVVGK